ncbi:MAG TPA: alpha/beta fold hydrolase [Flavobacterium sp.]|nr:alpha/beta fold hydrolase [Flavobacterium sp.]
MQHLLLLHGAIGAKDQLRPLAEMLEGQFTVHTLNFTGHGGAAMQENFSIEAFANDVLDYLSANGIDSVNIFGYSMGGYVALYLAKHHPEKIEKVFTLATKFLWTPEIAQRETKMLNAGVITEKIPAFAQQLEQRHLPNDWKLVLQKTSDMMIGLGNKNPLQNEDFQTISQSVLIGIGDKDTMVTLDETVAVYKSLPNANFVVFPNTPHPIEKVNTERLRREIEWFFLPQNLKA